MSKKVRILVGAQFEGRAYEPNQVVEFDDKMAKVLEKEGMVDSTAEAVAYCTGDLGVQSFKHESMADEEARVAADAAAAQVAVDANKAA